MERVNRRVWSGAITRVYLPLVFTEIVPSASATPSRHLRSTSIVHAVTPLEQGSAYTGTASIPPDPSCCIVLHIARDDEPKAAPQRIPEDFVVLAVPAGSGRTARPFIECLICWLSTVRVIVVVVRDHRTGHVQESSRCRSSRAHLNYMEEREDPRAAALKRTKSSGQPYP